MEYKIYLVEDIDSFFVPIEWTKEEAIKWYAKECGLGNFEDCFDIEEISHERCMWDELSEDELSMTIKDFLYYNEGKFKQTSDGIRIRRTYCEVIHIHNIKAPSMLATTEC